MDLTTLSDDELKALAAGKAPAPSPSPSPKGDVDLSHVSTETLSKIALGEDVSNDEIQPPKSVGREILDGVASVGRAVDSVTGAPVRAAIGAIQDGQSPSAAFGKQFAEDPRLAPTGQQIASKAGISNKPLVPLDPKQKQALIESQASNVWDEPGAKAWGDVGSMIGRGIADVPRDSAAGLGIDLVADPTNIISAGALIKGAGKAGMAATKGMGRLAATQVAEKAPVVAKAAEISKAAASSAMESLGKVFSPKRADDFEEFVAIAKKNGIDPKILPESIEFGQSSFISRASRSRAEGVLGEKKLEEFREGLSQVQGAVDNKISAISQGRPTTAVDAGQAIRDGFSDARSRVLDKDAITYNSIQKYAPGLRVNRGEMETLNSAIGGVEKFAKGRMIRGVTGTQREQAAQLLAATNAMRRSNGSFKQAVETLQMIGEVAFTRANSAADIPADTEKMRDLYFSYKTAIVNTIKKDVSPEMAAELLENNKELTVFFGDKSILGGVIGNGKIAPESVFQSVIMSGDTQKIASLKRMLTPEQFQQVKAAALENLIKRDPDGAFHFRTLFNAMRNKRAVLEALFDPQELADFGELVKLGDRFGNPIMSTSGTGASNVFKDIGGSIKDGFSNDVVIEGMKDRARGGVTAKAVKDAGKKLDVFLTPPARSTMKLPRRGKLERSAKGAQMYSVQQQIPRAIATDEEQ